MDARRSEVPVTETLGEDGPHRSRARWVTAALAVLGLVAAFAAGLESRGVSVGPVSLGGDEPGLAAGGLRTAPGGGFVVPVHNAGAAAVEVAVAALAGLVLRRSPDVRVPAGDWAEVPLTGRVDCAAAPAQPTRVALTSRGGDATEVPLAEPGRVVAELHEARCAPRRPLTVGRLAGVWLLERAFGRWTDLAGRHVLRFRRDGSFVADPEGVRFTAHRGVLGRYRLRGPFLDAVEQGFVGYACLPGDRAVWRAGQLRDGRLVLEYVRGRNCPDQPDELWVLRRLAR